MSQDDAVNDARAQRLRLLAKDLAAEFERALDMTDEQFHAVRGQIVQAIAAAVNGAGTVKPTVPDRETQLENFARWQGSHSPYYFWGASAMEALRQKMIELGDCELIPTFAHSVQVRLLPSQKILLIGRDGRETAG